MIAATEELDEELELVRLLEGVDVIDGVCSDNDGLGFPLPPSGGGITGGKIPGGGTPPKKAVFFDQHRYSITSGKGSLTPRDTSNTYNKRENKRYAMILSAGCDGGRACKTGVLRKRCRDELTIVRVIVSMNSPLYDLRFLLWETRLSSSQQQQSPLQADWTKSQLE